MKLGKYELVRKLATGGMAEVFLAKSRGPMGFEKIVVLKRILRHLAEDEQFVRMFLSEAQLAAKLNHARIAQIFDFGESDGDYFIAMEHVDGLNLRALAQRCAERGTPIPLPLVARMISYACEGLAYAHELSDPETGEWLRLIHRDISPDNILLARSGDLKLVDFGIAKAVSQVHRTSTGLIKGKLSYMCPEQISNKPLDLRADVYALGVVAYELICGTRPFSAESDIHLMQAIMYQPYVPVVERRPDVGEPLQRIVDRALAKDRDQRYQSCREMQGELDEYLRGVGRSVGSFELAALIRGVGAPLESGRGTTPPPKAVAATEGESPPHSTAGAPTEILPPKVQPSQAPPRPSSGGRSLPEPTHTPLSATPPVPSPSSPKRVAVLRTKSVLFAAAVASVVASAVFAGVIATRPAKRGDPIPSPAPVSPAVARAEPPPQQVSPPEDATSGANSSRRPTAAAPAPTAHVTNASTLAPAAALKRTDAHKSRNPGSGFGDRRGVLVVDPELEAALAAPLCSDGETLCGDKCVNRTSNAAHCGACDYACKPSQACVAGTCRCAKGLVTCGGDCVDLRTDPRHCGSCGKSCTRYTLFGGPVGRCVKGYCE